jgi:5,6-dimethylbenzimidazole synthase
METYRGELNAAFTQAEREAIYKVMRNRRDVRRFLPDPIPTEVLRRILEMAHLAPSVGFMQPWSFILISSTEVRCGVKAIFERTNAAELARIERTEQRDLYPALKLEGILEAPINIAVTCDGRGGPFVLGRAPMPETDVYSTCLAVQNLWLAARAEGVGVGWVSILDRRSIEELLRLPEGVRLVAYLCVGYPTEFGPRPMLEEVGWKARQSLSTAVFQDEWGVRSGLFSAPT